MRCQVFFTLTTLQQARAEKGRMENASEPIDQEFELPCREAVKLLSEMSRRISRAGAPLIYRISTLAVHADGHVVFNTCGEELKTEAAAKKIQEIVAPSSSGWFSS